MALHLAGLGFRVFAGVRKESDAVPLREAADGDLRPLTLDVTDSGHIAAAAETIESEAGERGLWGVVNNAGYLILGPVETTPLDEVDALFRVNLLGVLAVTQRFLPLVRRAQGRIVNVSSVNGVLSMPFVSAYCASKFALEAATDALRMELSSWGIGVSLIQPGITASDIRGNAFAEWTQRRDAMSEAESNLYREYYEAGLAMGVVLEEGAAGPEFVCAAVAHALTSEEPRSRYATGPDAPQFLEMAGMSDEERDAALLAMWEPQQPEK
jgi:NAD(P)-dependent dehydrogenase (short-subunit alcohol dehydrogenase family)